MKRKEKLRQIAKEAKSVLWAVIAIIVFWIVAGFGVSKLHITVFHTPLWAITGCIGYLDFFHYCRCISDETRIQRF